MFRSRVMAAVLISVSFACSGGAGDGGNNDGDAGSASTDASGASAGTQSAADLPDPCSLVTEKEISDLLWQGMEPNQRASHEARNSQYVFETRVENIDFPPGRTCYFQHKLVADTTTWSEGDFILRTLARETFDMFAEARGTKDPIPGVGDQAFYMQNAAYGRRGNIGVTVVEFGRESEIALLTAAVGRLP